MCQAPRPFKLPKQSTLLAGRGNESSIRGELLKPLIARIGYGDRLAVNGHSHIERSIELVGTHAGPAVFITDETTGAKGRVGLKGIRRRLELPDLVFVCDGYEDIAG